MPAELPYDFDEDAARSYLCAADGMYYAYLNRDAAKELQWSLNWLLRELPFGDDIDIFARPGSRLPTRGKSIGLCEIHLIQGHKQKKKGKAGLHTPEYDRLDYYVNPGEVQAACNALTALLLVKESRRQVQETVLFETLIVCLIDI